MPRGEPRFSQIERRVVLGECFGAQSAVPSDMIAGYLCSMAFRIEGNSANYRALGVHHNMNVSDPSQVSACYLAYWKHTEGFNTGKRGTR
ncbi:hypothetical protein PAXRUDRAFT_615718 [Paxillus rubicundulus Ve08.2h10]|uniref:Uncharacterized protein n=1 Tax=Paxillus rubicundulus Ve08.2h10 TaxID=930991 RepID=A0A0D0DT94_9AGAM|nr:hypothetical protein PAXRUDRAFT_615718 [Paxillus rubicundulus Ve08.2h10]